MRVRCVSSPYTITQKYGYDPSYPLNNGNHTGTDYISDGRILAPDDSTVAGTGYDSVNGNFLILESPNHRDWFSHIKTDGYLVKPGQLVKRGQHVAWQGRTGSATGVHVHHSLRVYGVMADPEKHITQGVEMLTLNRARILAHGILGRLNALTGAVDADLNRNHVGKKTTEQAVDAFYNSTEGKTWREKTLPGVYAARDNYLRLLRTEEAKTAELNKVISIKDNEITRLNALVGDTTKWQTLRTLLRELLGIN